MNSPRHIHDRLLIAFYTFIGLTEPMPGIEFAGGSMGMGLPAAVGFALAKKIKGEKGKVYCLMSDGELAIGTTWESLLIAVHHELDNLIVFVDANGYQAMGKVEEILGKFSYAKGITSAIDDLGVRTYPIDGHDYIAIENSLAFTFADRIETNLYKFRKRPTMIFCKTIKGKGVDFMENNNLYHYKNLSEDEYRQAKDILSRAD